MAVPPGKKAGKKTAIRTVKRPARPIKRAAKKVLASRVGQSKVAKKATGKAPITTSAMRGTRKMAKADGDAPVRAWIAAVRPEHRPIVARLDHIIASEVPGIKRAVKWSAPMYGVPGKGWIAAMGSFKQKVSLRFFVGSQLVPPPPLGANEMRSVDIASMADLDESQIRSWVKQASENQGWGKL